MSRGVWVTESVPRERDDAAGGGVDRHPPQRSAADDYFIAVRVLALPTTLAYSSFGSGIRPRSER